MAESKESIQAGCKKVCRDLAEREKAWLDDFYKSEPMKIKERETVELVQHAIDLPLQAQERVQEFFEKEGVAYVHTAWRELSEQLSRLDYEYVDWSAPAANHKDSRAKHRSGQKRKKDSPQLIVGVVKSTIEDMKELWGRQSQEKEDKKTPKNEELRQRIEDMKQRNKDRVDIWCAELANRMYSVLKKHLPPQ